VFFFALFFQLLDAQAILPILVGGPTPRSIRVSAHLMELDTAAGLAITFVETAIPASKKAIHTLFVLEF
jgi:hypothetical protein